MLSAYSITVMVLSLFSKHGDSAVEGTALLHPFAVLRKFLAVYSTFKWDSFVVTVDGPVAIQNGNVLPTQCVETKPCLFKPLINQFKGMHQKKAGSSETPLRFQLRACNIQDPIDNNNNLGIPVTRHNLMLVEQALKGGLQHLEYIIVYCLWQEQERQQKVICRNNADFSNKSRSMASDRNNNNPYSSSSSSSSSSSRSDHYNQQHQAQCKGHDNNHKNKSHCINNECSNNSYDDRYQQRNDYFVTKDEYFQNECDDVDGWESGSASNEPGKSKLCILCSRNFVCMYLSLFYLNTDFDYEYLKILINAISSPLQERTMLSIEIAVARTTQGSVRLTVISIVKVAIMIDQEAIQI
jgi:hypothetical protein